MADVVTRLVVESKEYDSKIARATSGLTQFEKKCREVGGTLEFVEKEDLDFVKALGQMDTVATTATGKMSELKKAFTELSIQYKNLTDAEKQSPYGQALASSLDELKGRIGDINTKLGEAKGELEMSGSAFEKFASGLGLPKGALKEIGSAMGSLGPVAGAAGKAMMGALGPVGIAIAAVTAAIKVLKGALDQLKGAFQRNEEALADIQKIAAPFKAIGDVIQRLLDDIVSLFADLYTNITRAVGGWDAFQTALKPIGAVLAAVRGALAVIGTALKDITKAVAIISEKVRDALKSSVVGDFFRNITDTVQGFFTTLTDWVSKIANSKLGKMLGLDELHLQLKEIVNAQDELTKSNKKIADSEKELGELRGRTKLQNAQDEQEIARLRADASDEERFSEKERLQMLKQAGDLEEGIMLRNIALRQKELDLVRLKNSKGADSRQEKDAEIDAEIALIQAQTEYQDKKRSLSRQMKGVKGQETKSENDADKLATARYKEDEAALIASLDRKSMSEQEYAKQVYQIQRATLVKIAALYKEGTTERANANAEILKLDTQFRDKEAAEALKTTVAQYKAEESAQVSALNRQTMTEQEYENSVYEIKKANLQRIAELYAEGTAERANANKAVEDLEIQHQNRLNSIAEKEKNKVKQKDSSTLSGILGKAKSVGWNSENLGIGDYKQKIEAGVDISDEEWNAVLQKLNERLQAFGMDPVKIDFETGNLEEVFDEAKVQMEKFMSDMSSGVGAISTIGNAFDSLKGVGEDLADAFSGDMDTWDALMTVFNSGISIMQTVMGVMEAINTLTEISSGLKKANTIATETEAAAAATAAGTEVAAEGEKALAAGEATAANTAEAASGAGKAMSGIPLVGPILAIAAIAAIIAAIMSAKSKAKSAGKFASGGVVGGNSYSGDRLMAYVNSGETILTPQQADRAMAGIQGNPMQNLQLSMALKGEDIQICLDNNRMRRGR